MADIFREIDEELRHERFDKLWRNYGRYLIGGAVAVVLGVFAYVSWEQYQESRRVEDSARFSAAKALLREGKPDDAQALFSALARESGTSYGTLARFHEAALLAGKSNTAAAIGIYDAIAVDSGVDEPLRDLALVLASLHALNAGARDTAALALKLTGLIGPGRPWRHSALEMLGVLAHKSGDKAKAREYFRRIVDDIDAPRNIRARATQLLATLGG